MGVAGPVERVGALWVLLLLGLLLIDWKDPTHVLILLVAVLVCSVLGIGLLALGTHISRVGARVVAALEPGADRCRRAPNHCQRSPPAQLGDRKRSNRCCARSSPDYGIICRCCCPRALARKMPSRTRCGSSRAASAPSVMSHSSARVGLSHRHARSDAPAEARAAEPHRSSI